MRLLVINYHYLRYKNKKFLASSGVGDKIFRDQLIELKKYYTPINFSEYKKISSSKKQDDDRYVIVTFDDGLKDCLTKVIPIAKKLKFPITFFAPGLPLEKQKVLTIQKIHLLLEKEKVESLAKNFYQGLKKLKKPIKRNKLKNLGIKGVYRYDTGLIRKFKLDLNYLLPYDVRDKIINKIFKRYYPDEKRLARQLYLSIHDLKKILKSGFEIGGHSYTHSMLSRLTPRKQEEEIEKNRKILDKITSESLPFSIPFGHIGTFNNTTKRLLKKYNFFNLVTTERKLNIDNYNQYDISRFDVNDVFSGSKLKKVL